MNTNNEMLAQLNAFRAAEGKPAFADWRKARHMPMLEAYIAAEEANNAPAPVGNDMADAVQSGDFAGNKEVQAAAADLASTKTYKEVAHYDKSLVDKPVGFVHQFLSDNPGMTRKQAVMALTEGYGVNFSTARTQYQRWFSAQKRK